MTEVAVVFTDNTVRQEGGLQDAGIEALYLLLSPLIRGRDTYGIGKEQKEIFLKILRKGNLALYLFFLGFSS